MDKKNKKSKIGMGRTAIRGPLTELFFFYLPLALTHIMMSGGTPIVNAGIARRPLPVEGLAAFAVAFSLSVLINSLCFSIEPAALALINGPRSRTKLLKFSAVLGFSISAFTLVLGLTPASNIIFCRFFGLEPHIAAQAAKALASFSPLPILLSMRSVGRATLTSVSRTSMVGWGTLFRLLAMILITVMGGADLIAVSGPTLGALAFVCGVFAEAVFVSVAAIKNKHLLPNDGENDIGMSYRSIINFSSPLIISGIFTVGINVAMNSILTRTPDSNIAVSAFSVVRSMAWFLSSMLIAFQQMVIAKGKSEEERKHVIRFCSYTVAIVVTLLAVIAYTPLGYLIMRHVIGVTGRVLESAEYTLLFVPIIPLVLGVRSYLRGATIRDHKPGRVLSSSIIALLFSFIVGLLVKDHMAVGAMVALLMWIAAQISEVIFLLLFRWRSTSKSPPIPPETW